jgi:hypothetical protein
VSVQHRQVRIINHAELTLLLAQYGEITPAAAKRILRTLVACIAAALQHGHQVRIANLGSFIPESRSGGRKFAGLVVAPEHFRVRYTVSPYILRMMREGIERNYSGRQRKAFRQPPKDEAQDASAEP